ncbi:hypothetical protein FN846DRAFT_26259 [Sphaerosporella brunnea]|uniref:Uncharacterized protein n=1 Tax=Sphaerosporella brunnea TaxID=1250544 RepID=A0A5J5EUH6_9PEZI|nr:hypothetical protein FN846DRAFT_26259 [Sphaerosporella brunnea]
MTDTSRSPWLSSEGRWRDSGSSGPKTPVLGPTQEMGRSSEALLAGTPHTTRSRESSNRSSRHYTSSPVSPISPLDRSGMDYANVPPTIPPPAQAQTRRQNAMLEIRHSVQRLPGGQLDAAMFAAVEEQPEPEPAKKKWWWQKPRWKGAQNRLITAAIAGIMCMIMLTIYLGLALSKPVHLQQEWHVLFILIIMVLTLFFCHSLARLAIEVTSNHRGRSGEENFARIPSIAGPGGYAVPRTPIRVNTQAPEIVSGMKEPPPVYGLWRCSVRVNPDQFYWERRRSAALEPNSPVPSQPRSATMSPRPPSYLSDDGVSYAINAVPEIRTVMDAQLPPHPSERGRLP